MKQKPQPILQKNVEVWCLICFYTVLQKLFSLLPLAFVCIGAGVLSKLFLCALHLSANNLHHAGVTCCVIELQISNWCVLLLPKTCGFGMSQVMATTPGVEKTFLGKGSMTQYLLPPAFPLTSKDSPNYSQGEKRKQSLLELTLQLFFVVVCPDVLFCCSVYSSTSDRLAESLRSFYA